MSKTAERVAVMQAHEAGKAIEFARAGSGDWKETSDPGWNWAGFDYRIKPREMSAPTSEEVIRDALMKVICAVRDYLPPDGCTQDEFTGRVIGAVDNRLVVEALRRE